MSYPRIEPVLADNHRQGEGRWLNLRCYRAVRMDYSELELENQHVGPMTQRTRGLGPWDQNAISTIHSGGLKLV